MSDERLGTNPLDWVTPDAAPDAARPSGETTRTTPPSDKGKTDGPADAPRKGLFSPVGTENEEDTMGKGKIKIKQTMDTPQLAAYLKDLADSLESGVIRAENEEGTLVLSVPDSMQVELKLARKKDKAKCEIELEWLDDGSRIDPIKISGE
jgi:amphi-Trp domain-containing protein